MDDCGSGGSVTSMKRVLLLSFALASSLVACSSESPENAQGPELRVASLSVDLQNQDVCLFSDDSDPVRLTDEDAFLGEDYAVTRSTPTELPDELAIGLVPRGSSCDSADVQQIETERFDLDAEDDAPRALVLVDDGDGPFAKLQVERDADFEEIVERNQGCSPGEVYVQRTLIQGPGFMKTVVRVYECQSHYFGMPEGWVDVWVLVHEYIAYGDCTTSCH